MDTPRPGFQTALAAELVKDDLGDGTAEWRLIRPLRYLSALIGVVTVPEGFVTNLASAPRIPMVWWLAGGIGDAPAVVHDYLYSVRTSPREVCDAVYFEALTAAGVSAWRVRLMYWAVRVFGESYY